MTLDKILIPTAEVKQDILDTKEELKNLQDENTILMRDPVKNKLRIYLNEGHIGNREELISKMESLLKHRGEM